MRQWYRQKEDMIAENGICFGFGGTLGGILGQYKQPILCSMHVTSVSSHLYYLFFA
jgi:hypothetical protein